MKAQLSTSGRIVQGQVERSEVVHTYGKVFSGRRIFVGLLPNCFRTIQPRRCLCALGNAIPVIGEPSSGRTSSTVATSERRRTALRGTPAQTPSQNSSPLRLRPRRCSVHRPSRARAAAHNNVLARQTVVNVLSLATTNGRSLSPSGSRSIKQVVQRLPGAC
jgi:hypothetical protein